MINGYRIDGFSILYSGIALFMWICALGFSREYYHREEHKLRYYLFLVLAFFGTIGVFLSRNLYITLLFFEFMSLTSYVWVAQEETKKALRAAKTYLIVGITGGMVMVMGLFLLYDVTKTLDIGLLYEACSRNWQTKSVQLYVAGACLLFGFGAKAGVFPMHFWLPKAHPVAPAPASALLSGILTKCGIFGMVILTVEVFRYQAGWGVTLLILGGITMLIGALMGVFSVNLKRTLACSSVSQIGFITTGLGMQCMLGEDNYIAIGGTLLHMVNHSLIKLVLFLCAGAVYMNLEKLSLNEIQGYGRNKPFLKICFLTGALSIAGVPGFSGYISKTLLHESIVEKIHILTEAGSMAMGYRFLEWVFLLSGGLTLAYMLKIFVCLFIEKNPHRQEVFDKKKNCMNHLSMAAVGIPALVLFMCGILPHGIMDRIARAGQGFFHGSKTLEGIAYFSLSNLRGACISLGIGAITYFFFVRKVLIKNRGEELDYVNLWPGWLDVEILFSGILRGILWLVGVICKWVDELPYKLFLVVKTGLGCICKQMDILADKIIEILKVTVYRETTKKDESRFLKAFHERYDANFNTMRLVGASLSFGLLLACTGLLLTLVYLLVGK